MEQMNQLIFSTINLLLTVELVVIGFGAICVIYLLYKIFGNK